MLKIKNYVKAESLEQAYELNQKRTACVLGGMVWLKMGNRNIMTAIDLSGLGLDTITETEEAFVIGCMTPLHALETHKELNAYTNSAIREVYGTLWCAVSKLCHSGRKYFRKIRIFRCTDHVSGTGYLGGAVQWRNHSAGTVCIHGKG